MLLEFLPPLRGSNLSVMFSVHMTDVTGIYSVASAGA
jgi:hypothetical protein